VWQPTAAGDAASLAVISRGEYGIPEGLQFGFPIISDGKSWKVEQGLPLDDFAKEKIRVTTEELEAERAEVLSLLS
jgi:malate dehydrogenase